MTSPRFIRTVAVIASSAFVLGAFVAGPADAKKKKKKKPAVCAEFQPGEKGTDKPTLKVTDAATEEAPAVQKVTLAESLGDARLLSDIPEAGPLASAHDAFNIQVDSAAKEAGLYISFEFPQRRDYDLEVWHTDGSYAARSHDFNPVYSPVPDTYSNGGHAGEATDSSEKIIGLRTSDCGGWTVEAVNWLGEGGEFEIKVWLGEIVNDPQEPGAETP